MFTGHLLKLIRILPAFIFYLFSDLLRFVAVHLIRYRREVVTENIQNSFPNKSSQEIQEIAKKQYTNFCDVLVEPLIAYSFNKKHWQKRVELSGIDPIRKYLNEGTAIVLVAGHLANWEWGGFALRSALGYPLEFLYKDIEHGALNKFMLSLRSHKGQVGIEKDKSMREFIKRRKEPRILALVSDQIPAIGTDKTWINFLSQETAFYQGAERTAVAFQYPVFYAEVVRIKRGQYKVQYTEIAKPPFDRGVDYSITEKFASRLEQSIKLYPESYLWSHKRWKYTKEEEEQVLMNSLKTTRS